MLSCKCHNQVDHFSTNDSDGSWLCMAAKRINFLISRRAELVAKS